MERDFKTLENYLEELFRQKKFSGMAIAIRGPEGLLFCKGLGFRNKERTITPDENTIFGIASMSKSMVGLACRSRGS